jgi:hypothetical protein
MKGGNTAVVTKVALKYKLGKWRVYDVVFMTKRARLIADHEVKVRYSNLYRITDYLFLGLNKKEKQK